MAGDEHPEVPDTHISLTETRLADLTVHRAGDVVGRRWRLERFLDGGGMGAVWEATDLRLDERAAVKLLNSHLVRTSEAQTRFLREARAAAQLRGPNVVSVLDFDIDERSGSPYLAMELLRGENLSARLQRGPLGNLLTRSVLGDVCRAMARAHRAGIIHRDLKPANIFLAATEEGLVAKVLDFGIAKLSTGAPGGALTEPGRALGTPHYMSPEQISDAKHVDHRADLWSLAVIAYECMVGQLAFPGEQPLQVIQKICLVPPVPASQVADVPRGFDEWFNRATRQEPDARFGSVEEMLEAFLALPPAGAADPEPKPTSPRPRAPRARAWVSDANQIDIETIDDLVFKNAVVEEFLNDDRRHFVSGAKGCGKTLLLTYKRARLGLRYQQAHQDKKGEAAPAVTFIPEGRPYLDLMGDLRTVGKATVELMANLTTAKRLWGFALRMSVISYQSGIRLPTSTLAALPLRLRAVADGQRTEPTVVVKELLALTTSQIHQVLDQAEMAFEHAIRSVHSGVFLFLDKIDQALRGVSREAWVAMQAGMVEAAWDLMNTNAHVKVFATIREEAFSTYESHIKTNLFGATTRIRYSKRDLRAMLERLTSYYEGLPLEDFVTLDMVASGGRGQAEGSFDFIYRHTLGRPRDLVIVASEISRRRDELDERTFKAIVRETCAGILVANVFDEMGVFLHVLGDRQSRVRFLGCILQGALSRNDLIEAWCRFHGVERAYYDEYARYSTDVFHPFRELYDCGLLGFVTEDRIVERRLQRFKQPHDPLDAFTFDLPTAEIYLLHPSLVALMHRQGIPDGDRLVRDIVVGHEVEWKLQHSLLVRIRRELFRVGSDGNRSAIHAVRELLSELVVRVSNGQPFHDVRRDLGTQEDFAELCARLEELGWDDLQIALLEWFGPGDLDDL